MEKSGQQKKGKKATTTKNTIELNKENKRNKRRLWESMNEWMNAANLISFARYKHCTMSLLSISVYISVFGLNSSVFTSFLSISPQYFRFFQVKREAKIKLMKSLICFQRINNGGRDQFRFPSIQYSNQIGFWFRSFIDITWHFRLFIAKRMNSEQQPKIHKYYIVVAVLCLEYHIKTSNRMNTVREKSIKKILDKHKRMFQKWRYGIADTPHGIVHSTHTHICIHVQI